MLINSKQTYDILLDHVLQETVIHKTIKEITPFTIMFRDELTEESKFDTTSRSCKD